MAVSSAASGLHTQLVMGQCQLQLNILVHLLQQLEAQGVQEV